MSVELVGPALEMTQLRASLLSEAPNEAGAVLLCHVHTMANSHRRILVKEIVQVPAASYMEQRPDRLVIDPLFLAPVLKRARQQECSVVVTHTHPFSEWPEFSLADDHGEEVLIPAIFKRVPGKSHGALVLGRAGFSGRLYIDEHHAAPAMVETMILVGSEVRRATFNSSSTEMDAAYDRNVRAFGVGQQQLQQMSVGIVGLGGIGSIVAEQLAHLGVSRMTLVDFDELDVTNLNRVAGASRSDVGDPKVKVTKRLVNRIAPHIKVTDIQGSILAQANARLLLKCDFVFCCTDSHGSRAVLNQLAYQYLVPMIDTGVRIDAKEGKIVSMAARVQMLSPGLPCLVCGNLLDSEEIQRDFLSDGQRKADPYITGYHEPQPAIMSINGTVASLAVTMFQSAVVGLPSTARHVIYLIG